MTKAAAGIFRAILFLSAALAVTVACGGVNMGPTPLLVSSSAPLPDGVVDAPYSHLILSGGQPPFLTTLTGGSLPPGLAIDSSGSLTGTPSAAGTFSFSIEAADAQNPPFRGKADLSVQILPRLELAAGLPPAARVGQPYFHQFSASGGVSPYVFSVSGGSLPAGLALDSATGILSGTPSTAFGSAAVVIKVADSHPGSPDATRGFVLRSAAQGARFGYLTDGQAISTLAIDSSSEFPRHQGYLRTNATEFVIHPGGAWGYSVADGTGLLRAYSIDPASGALTQISSYLAPGLQTSMKDVTVHPSGRFLYIAHPGGNLVSMYAIDPGTGIPTPIGGGTVPTVGSFPKCIAIDPGGRFLYTADRNGNGISSFAIDLSTGALNPLGSVSAGTTPEFLAVHPSGGFAYALCGAGLIAIYARDSYTGALSFLGNLATGSPPLRTLTFSPFGQFAYVTSGNGLLTYSVSPGTGALTFLAGTGGAYWTTAFDPGGEYLYAQTTFRLDVFLADPTSGELLLRRSLSVRPTLPWRVALLKGSPVQFKPRFAFVANSGSGSISRFQVDPADGSLAPLGTTAAGLGPQGGAATRNGKFLIVPNALASTLTSYQIDSGTGALSVVGSVATGTHPAAVILEPSDRFCFVAEEGSNTVGCFSLDPLTGALTSLGSTPSGTSPSGVAVHPAGHLLFSSNRTGESVTRYQIEPFSGALTLLGSTLTGLGSLPADLQMDPAGELLYHADSGTGGYGIFRVIPDGTLQTGQDTTTGSGPLALACDPTARFVYAMAGTGNDVRGFLRNDDGTLLPGVPIGSPLQVNLPSAGVVDPGGRFLFVTSSTDASVRRYSIDPATGVLNFLGSVATQNSPRGVVVTALYQ